MNIFWTKEHLIYISYIIMYKSCHYVVNIHISCISKTGYVRPQFHRMSMLTQVRIFRFWKGIFHHCFCGHFLVIWLFAVSFSLSSTSLIASATVTAALLILSSNTLFSAGEGRASSPRLKSPRNPKIVAICFMLKLGKSPGLKRQKILNKTPKYFLETYY